jgi:hypothetical protein
MYDGWRLKANLSCAPWCIKPSSWLMDFRFICYQWRWSWWDWTVDIWVCTWSFRSCWGGTFRVRRFSCCRTREIEIERRRYACILHTTCGKNGFEYLRR